MIYEYSCPTCGIIEVEQKLADPQLKYCPKCEVGGSYVEISKLISAPSLKFTGSGFYKTDYPKTEIKKDEK